MEAQKPSRFGCLYGLVSAIAVSALTLTLCWNIPVGETDKGYPVLVGDYVEAIPALFGVPPETKPAVAADSSTQGTHIDAKDKIGAELFSDLTPGVTHASTVRDLLNEGELVSSSSVAGISTESYTIRNSDGSYVTLIFQNGILSLKSQSGLY